MRLSVVVLTAAILMALAATAARSEGTWSLDLFAFSQEDDGGQALRAEGFAYGGVRMAGERRLNAASTLVASAAVAWIDNDAPTELPATIGNAQVTSASTTVVTLDASFGVRTESVGGQWSRLIGLFYHHQYGYIVGGPDLEVTGRLAGGDTVVTGAFRGRVSFPKLEYWDFTDRGRDYQVTGNLSFGITQTLTPAWLVGVSGQLAHQIGFLSDPYNYVVQRSGEVPVRLRDERLPGRRDRAQLNVRTRWSPRRGLAFGVDGSGYVDSWGARHGAVEPSAAVRLGAVTTRVWVRLSDQRAIRYFDPTGRRRGFVTQDSDLDAHGTTGGGITIEGPAVGVRWRVAAQLLDRDDGIRVGGVSVGSSGTW